MISSAHKPLYKQLVDEFLQDVKRGKLKVGDRLPPESDYAASLGVSRSTVRLAFSKLEQFGIIQRRKRGGTEIIAAVPIQHYSMTTQGVDNVISVTRDSQLDLTDVRMVSTAEYDELAGYADESARWLRCTGTRTMEGQRFPTVWSQIFVHERFSGLSVRVTDTPTSIFDLIEQQYGQPLSRVKQRYSAALCEPEVAAALGLNAGDPSLTLVAEMFNARGDLLQIVRSIFDPARFQIVTDVNVTGIN